MSEDIVVKSDCPVALQLLKSKRFLGRRPSGPPLESTGKLRKTRRMSFSET